MNQISDNHIELGFESKEWTIQFQTLSKNYLNISNSQTGQ